MRISTPACNASNNTKVWEFIFESFDELNSSRIFKNISDHMYFSRQSFLIFCSFELHATIYTEVLFLKWTCSFFTSWFLHSHFIFFSFSLFLFFGLHWSIDLISLCWINLYLFSHIIISKRINLLLFNRLDILVRSNVA
jgi:hypothetical protein